MEPRAWADIGLSAVAMLLLFGTCMTLYIASILSNYVGKKNEATAYAPVALENLGDSIEEGKQEEVTPPQANAKVFLEPLKMTPGSINDFLKMMTELGLILLYSWICEYQPFYTHGQKHTTKDHFWFLALIMALIAFLRIDKTATTDILNREQTEEWKGWMQYIFLAYHYFHFSDVYNAIRIFISCYVWMTGFGNFSFFYIKSDYTWLRWWAMMWRLNFLVFFLCMVHGNTYILYYICPLHTFYFCMVYVTMRVFKNVNHTQWMIRFKILAVGVLIFVVWEIPGVFETVFFFLPTTQVLGANGGTQKEFHFRTSLDHWSSFFGMIFALNFPYMTTWFAKVEALAWQQQVLIKGAIACVLIAMAKYYFTEIFPLPKLAYNEMHPYFFLFPMMAYIFLRNITVGARSYFLYYLGEMGKITLETYLMQHHIWLTSNAKTLLVLVPEWPQVNMFVTTAIYIFLSRRLYRLTLNLRAMMIPNEFVPSLKFLMWIVFAFLGAFAAALLLITTDSVNPLMAVITIAVLTCLTVAFVRLYMRNMTAARGAALVLAALFLVALIVHVIYISVGDSAAAPPTPTTPKDPKMDGIAQDLALGCMSMVFACLMLFSSDNFYSLSWISAQMSTVLGTPFTVGYEEAYSKILGSARR